jgi:hypothetical protein
MELNLKKELHIFCNIIQRMEEGGREERKKERKKERKREIEN